MSEYASDEHRIQAESMIERNMKSQSLKAQHERIGSYFLSKTNAYGKLILFGEHFVVYKVPALVGAIAGYTNCECEFTGGTGLEVIDNRPAVPGYKVEKKEEGDQAIALVLKHFNLNPAEKGVRLTFGGDLCAESGIGASAAQVSPTGSALINTNVPSQSNHYYHY